MRYLVTGAFGGIGATIVEHLLGQGHDVVAHDVHVDDSLSAKWRDSSADRILAMAGDLSAPEVLAELGSLDRVDRVIAAHGIGGAGALSELSAEFVERVLRINFLSVVELFDATRPTLIRADGSFVALSSQAGLRGERLNSAYCAAKFALVGWASTVDSGGVRVRTLCPGAIDAGMFRGVAERQAADEGVPIDEVIGRRLATISIGRLGRPEEIAEAAVWLGNLRTPLPLTVAVNGGDTFF